MTSISKSFTLFLSSFSSSKSKAGNERFISLHDQSSEMVNSLTVYFIYFTNCYKEEKKRFLANILWSSRKEAFSELLASKCGIQNKMCVPMWWPVSPSALWPVILLMFTKFCICFFMYNPYLYQNIIDK